MPKKYFSGLVAAVLFSLLVIPCSAIAQHASGSQKQTPQIPLGQEEESIDADVFGPEGGYLHPFLFVDGTYTDNLYYTNTNEQDDFITTLAPGFWIAVPGNRERLLHLNTSPINPGGLRVSRMKPASSRRMQTYFMYSPSFVFYSDNSQHDNVNHQAEGLFLYNFDMGLSIDLMDSLTNGRKQTTMQKSALMSIMTMSLICFLPTSLRKNSSFRWIFLLPQNSVGFCPCRP
jgi:hypothetical protein